MSRPPTSPSRLRRALRRLVRRTHARVAMRGVLATLAVGGGVAAAVLFTLGRLDHLPPALKLGLTATALLAVAAVLLRTLVVPLARLRRAAVVARELDRRAGLRNHLVAAEESLRRPDRWSGAPGVSDELVARLQSGALQQLERLRLHRAWPVSWAGASLLGAVMVAAATGWWLLATPAEVERAAERVRAPWRNEASAPTVGLYLAPGPGPVIAGASVTLAALDFGRDPEQPAVCEIRRGSGLWQPVSVRAEPAGSAVGESLLVGANLPPAHHRWLAEVTDVREDLVFRFRRGARTTRERTVTVWHPPILAELSGAIVPPDYTGLPRVDMPLLPAHLEVLAGSELRLVGRANHDLVWAAAVAADGDTMALEVAGDRMRGRLAVTEPLSFSLLLRDRRGLNSDSPLTIEVAVTPDRVPRARLTRPGEDTLLPLAGDVDLLAEASDDFGVAEMRLLLRREGPMPSAGVGSDEIGSDWSRLPLWPLPAGGAQASAETPLGRVVVDVAGAGEDGEQGRLDLWRRLRLNAGELDLVPGEVLLLALEVVDNREPAPGQTARSSVLRLAMPSAAEILTSRAEQERGHRGELEALRRRSGELGADLERLQRELLKSPLPDFARRQQIESALERHQTMQQELSRVAGQLQADLESLAQNALTSQELLERMDMISDLLRDLQNEELERLLERMRQESSRLAPDEIAAAVDEVRRNQQETIRRLDNALAMLRDMAREQELEGMTSLLAQLLRRQQELTEQNRAAADEGTDGEPEGAQSGDDERDGEQGEGEQGEGEQGEGEQGEGEQGEGEQEGEQGEGEQGEGEGESEPNDGSPDAESGDPTSDAASAQEMAERQQALARELEQLEERLQEALEQVQRERTDGDQSPSGEQMQQALEEAMRQLEEQQTARKMSDAAQQMQQGQPGSAAQQQQQALRDLASLYHVMLQSQMAMEMAMQQHQAASLRRFAADLLALSHRQEEIATRVPADLRDLGTTGLARQQHRVLRAARTVRDELSGLTTDAPMQIMRMLSRLDTLLEELGRSLHFLEEGRGTLARRTAGEGLAAMNRIVIDLLTQAQMTGAGSGGGGGGSTQPAFGQQLRDMAREQAGLNALTQEMRDALARQQRVSQELRSQMRRLGEGQDALAERAREIAEEERRQRETSPDAGGRILGDLDQLAREMEQVARGLDDGMVDQATLLRQERILGRLLDAHNSVRQRDYSRRRESRAAERLYSEQDGLAPGRDGEGAAPLQRRYEPVEKAPVEYRDLVRQYFHLLDQLRRDTAPSAPGGVGAGPGVP
ncbi:MAG: DUF4175 family protein [Candidatus Krumholzibacteriia bacterium]